MSRPDPVAWRATTRISDTPLHLDEHLSAVADDACGAETTFVGRVRNHSADVDGTVFELEYSAHPDAAWVIQQIAEGVLAAHSGAGVMRLSAAHRIGVLTVREPAIVVCVSAAHRGTAFEVCRAFVERVKAELPIWKRQRTADGRSHWVGM